MSGSEIEFVGPFEERERSFLASQFNRCRFELIRRSSKNPTVCLLTWSGLQSRPTGPAPIRSLPREAAYVLRGQALTRVETLADAERELGEPIGDLHVRGLRRPNPLLDGAKEALRGFIPWR